MFLHDLKRAAVERRGEFTANATNLILLDLGWVRLAELHKLSLFVEVHATLVLTGHLGSLEDATRTVVALGGRGLRR